MEVQVEVGKHGLASVQWGPLVYCLAVQGQRRSVDQWGSFEELVTPTSKWNYALVVDIDKPARSFTCKSLQVSPEGCLWEHPRAALEVEAVRLPDWKTHR
jgi:hypothetical protein